MRAVRGGAGARSAPDPLFPSVPSSLATVMVLAPISVISCTSICSAQTPSIDRSISLPPRIDSVFRLPPPIQDENAEVFGARKYYDGECSTMQQAMGTQDFWITFAVFFLNSSVGFSVYKCDWRIGPCARCTAAALYCSCRHELNCLVVLTCTTGARHIAAPP